MAKILIVDDDATLLSMYSEKLKIEGFEVETVGSGEGALTLITQKNIDLILLDIMISGKMNGFDVLEALKKDERYKKIPVIVLTNLDSEAKVAKDVGAVDYLVKANIDLNTLVEKVKSYL